MFAFLRCNIVTICDFCAVGSRQKQWQHSDARRRLFRNRGFSQVSIFQLLFAFLISYRALAAHAESLGSGSRGAERAAVFLAGGGTGEDAVADLVEQGRWQVILSVMVMVVVVG